MKNVQKLIEKYQLEVHPEGGFYKEVYRSEQIVNSPINNNERNALTHIYFLLIKNQVSRFYKVHHDEIWNFYEGAPLKLIEFYNSEICETIIGRDSYINVIKGGAFQAAETTGEYTLVGCSVAPGFDFSDFSFLDENKELTNKIKMKFPEYGKYI